MACTSEAMVPSSEVQEKWHPHLEGNPLVEKKNGGQVKGDTTKEDTERGNAKSEEEEEGMLKEQRSGNNVEVIEKTRRGWRCASMGHISLEFVESAGKDQNMLMKGETNGLEDVQISRAVLRQKSEDNGGGEPETGFTRRTQRQVSRRAFGGQAKKHAAFTSRTRRRRMSSWRSRRSWKTC